MSEKQKGSMSEKREEPLTNKAGPENSSPGAPGPVGLTRSAAAGREFLKALYNDLTKLAAFGSRSLFVRRRGKTSDRRESITARSVVLGFVQLFAVFLGLMAAALAMGMAWALRDLPPLARPIGDTEAPSLVLEAVNGEPLGRVGPLKSSDLSREDFSSLVVKAIISSEDQRFFRHWGIDPEGILRALHRNLAAGAVVEGGSTITQQLVKIRLLRRSLSLIDKMREAFVAVWLERQLTKEEILTRYLNSVYMGNGAYGVSAAARLYFDKRPAELRLSEAALLAGVIRCPSRCNPVRDLSRARERANVVIDSMVASGVVDAAMARDAQAHPAVLNSSETVGRAGSWFADWVSREAANLIDPSSGNLLVRTTLNPQLQAIAEQSTNEVLAASGPERGASQAALVAMRPNGAVVAMVGGRDYRASQFNRAVDAKRQPGSAFKLFVYLAALRHGFAADDSIDASPLKIKDWEPENYGGRRYGRVPLSEAFAQSINTAAARLAQEVGLNEVIAAAHDLGIKERLPAIPSLALGAVDVSLLDLTGAYASVRADKVHVEPWGISGFGTEGESALRIVKPPSRLTRSLQPYRQPLIELLQLVVQRGTGRTAALDGFAAGKTGTSGDYRDAWFIGFNDDLVTGVWVGNDDRTPMKQVTGGSLPAEIWKRFMSQAVAIAGPREPQMTHAPVDSATPQASSGKPPVLQCDYQACSRSYDSFRTSDCTYQPYDGPRKLCAKNVSISEAAPPESASEPPYSDSQAQCNHDICSSMYGSFDPSDCTYQPYGGGPRRICDR
jgi:penicillin-binding protein 1A